MFGREVFQPEDVVFGLAQPAMEADGDSYVKGLPDTMSMVHSRVRANLKRSQAAMKRTHDVRAILHEFAAGDLVYKLDTAGKKGQSPKLWPIFKGPYLVVEVLAPAPLKIRGRKTYEIVHHDRLRICRDRSIPLRTHRLRHKQMDLDETIAYAEEEDVVHLEDSEPVALPDQLDWATETR